MSEEKGKPGLQTAIGLYGVAASVIGAVFIVGSWQSRTEQTETDHDRRIVKLENTVEQLVPQVAGIGADVRYVANAERERQQDRRGER